MVRCRCCLKGKHRPTGNIDRQDPGLQGAGSWLPPVKLPQRQGCHPPQGNRWDMLAAHGHSGRGGKAWLSPVGVNQHRQPQRPSKPCSPAYTSPVKHRFAGRTPPLLSLSFLPFPLKPQPQWVGGYALMINSQSFMLVSPPLRGLLYFSAGESAWREVLRRARAVREGCGHGPDPHPALCVSQRATQAVCRGSKTVISFILRITYLL